MIMDMPPLPTLWAPPKPAIIRNIGRVEKSSLDKLFNEAMFTPGFIGKTIPSAPLAFTGIGRHTGTGNGTTQWTLTTAVDVPAGAVIVLGIQGAVASITSISDGVNSYTIAHQATWNYRLGMAYSGVLASTLPAGSSIVVTYSANTNTETCVVGGYISGFQAGSLSFDQAVSDTIGNAYCTTGTLAQANEILIGFSCGYITTSGAIFDPSYTHYAGWTQVEAETEWGADINAMSLDYRIVAATTAIKYGTSYTVHPLLGGGFLQSTFRYTPN